MAESPADQFDLLISLFITRPGVTPPDSTPRGFGANSLRVKGKIFVLVARTGGLIFKLPREVVTAYVNAGEGRHWDANKGVPMKEWFVIGPNSTLDPVALANAAYIFVRDAIDR
jgi:hypothetical protein